jgi:ankyrin repeat protein
MGLEINTSGDDLSLTFSNRPPTRCAVRKPESLRMLLSHGANPDQRSPLGEYSVMDSPAAVGNVDALTQLIKHGGNVKTTNALWWTIRNQIPNMLEIAGILLDAGASINAPLFAWDPEYKFPNHFCDCNETALHLALRTQQWHIVNFLLDKGASMLIKMVTARQYSNYGILNHVGLHLRRTGERTHDQE